jgi:hypothetical protein
MESTIRFSSNRSTNQPEFRAKHIILAILLVFILPPRPEFGQVLHGLRAFERTPGHRAAIVTESNETHNSLQQHCLCARLSRTHENISERPAACIISSALISHPEETVLGLTPARPAKAKAAPTGWRVSNPRALRHRGHR